MFARPAKLQREAACDKMLRMKYRHHVIVLLACLSGSFHDAVASEAATSSITENQLEYFEKHIRPLLVEHCYQCHSGESGERQGGLLLDSRAGWQAGGESGPPIVPGDVESSLLIRAVRYDDGDLQMPPDGALDAGQIARLERWVQMGAPDPREASGVAISQVIKPSDPVSGREHWAFAPLRRTSPPTVGAQHWPRSPIDSFVQSKLESEGLAPREDADRRTLIRRLSFQLIGLPPAPEDVEAFVSDESPRAYQRLVDRLLDSPQFGERWGRHWLDLARYADSNGLDENFLFREAWRYRNWVIDAINDDMPLDEFLLQQIAGDLLPYETTEQRDRQRIAAGFMVVGPKVLLGNDPRQRRMDIADEQLDTIGKTFLGMTLGCARCHDHKFDPVPTSDYYALAGILTSTQVLEKRYMLGQQREMEQLVGLGADGQQLDESYETYWREQPKAKERIERVKSALEHLKKSDNSALTALVKEHPEALAEDARDDSIAMEERIKAQSRLLEDLVVAFKPPAIPPRAMVPSDVEAPADESIRLSGQFDRLGQVVPRGVLQVIGDEPFSIADGQSGRLELAHWLAEVDQGAGRLVARVVANRVWYHLIGRGLVRTVDNFGRTGEPPSHPELLDYLAGELIESGWSIKSLVRTIVASRTFTMSSRHDPQSHAVDPDNRLLWRAHRRRLDPESLRDATLMAGRVLDFSQMESTVWYLGDQATAVGANKNRRRTDFPCRSVYLPVIRNDLPELFDSFDFADPHATTGMRPETIVAPQGFFLLNDDSVMAAADAIAKRVVTEDRRQNPREIADAMCRIVYSGYSTRQLQDELLSFVESASHWNWADSETDRELRAWSAACHALLASSRFQILE